MRGMPVRSRRLAFLVFALTLMTGATAAPEALASHFRYGNLTWQKAGPTTEGQIPVTFQYEQSWRRSFFAGSGGDGLPEVGDILPNSEGCIEFGDGETSADANGECRFRVTFVNRAEDYLIMNHLAPGSTSDRNVPHAYTGSGPFTATSSSCCTIGGLGNAAGEGWSISSLVDLANDDESPRATVPPIVQVREGGVQTFTVPAGDAGGEPRRFRLTTAAESCAECPDPHPPGLTIDSSSGEVSWDTTGRGGSSEDDPATRGLWWTGVVVEALSPSGQIISSTQIDYIIRVSDQQGNQSPFWEAPTPADGSVFTLTPGETLSLALQARDPDSADQVEIAQNSGPGSLTATRGNPGTAVFSYTATDADVGSEPIVQFIAQDNGSPPLGPPFRSFTVRVVGRAVLSALSPPSASPATGSTHSVTAKVTSSSTGEGLAGRAVRYVVTGANPTSGEATSDGNGDVRISWTGSNVGRDTIDAFVDVNRNGLKDSGEDTKQATVDWGAASQAATISLDPPHASRPVRSVHTVRVTMPTSDTVRYTITGANPSSGALITGPAGFVDIHWTGEREGEDTLTAFIDLNGDAVRQPSEPQEAVTVLWRVLEPGKTVTLRPSGIVRVTDPLTGRLVRLIPGKSVLPVGTVVDATKGKVTLTSAFGSGGRTQSAEFSRGMFQIKQKGARGVTELKMVGGSFRGCSRRARRGDARAAQRRRPVRRLFGRGRGRFRTTGRNSAATVRGTTWRVLDLCEGTLTQVKSGSVNVKDLTLGKTIRVGRGDSYLAPARCPRRAKRRSRRRGTAKSSDRLPLPLAGSRCVR